MPPVPSSSPLHLEDLPEPLPWTWRQRSQRALVAGLVVLVPVALTAFILYQLFIFLDGIFEPLILCWAGAHVPGVGVLLTLLVVLFLGWLSTNVLGRRLIYLAERLMARVPIGRSVYSASKSVLEILSERQTDAFKRVILIEHPRQVPITVEEGVGLVISGGILPPKSTDLSVVPGVETASS